MKPITDYTQQELESNLDLMKRLEAAKKALQFYADPDCSAREKIKGELAYKTLQEIEK